MTLLRPGMTGRITLPDGSVFHVEVAKDGVPDPDIDTLSGRALDAAIAARLFDLKVEQRANARTREDDYVYEANPGAWVRVSFYSERMGPCLNVEAELSKRGWMRKDSRPGHAIFEHKDGRIIEADGPTLNVAICHAALKALLH